MSGEGVGPCPDAIGVVELAARRREPGDVDGHQAFHDVFRAGTNHWGVAVGDLCTAGDLGELVALLKVRMRAAVGRGDSPSVVLSEVHDLLTGRAGPAGPAGRESCAVVLARIELLEGGARAMLAGAGHPRPIVVRHAGWVDLQGQASGPLGVGGTVPTDVRIGLGPGDALVLCSEALTASRSPEGEAFGDKVLPDALVDCIGQSPDAMAGRILTAATEFRGDRLHHDAVVLVFRIPEAIKSRGWEWVAEATGVPVENLEIPDHAGRDASLDLWEELPAPPQEALTRLAPDPPSVPALRRLVRRLLRGWGIDAVVESDIELLATEVATSAFMRTSSPVTVVIRYTGHMLRVEVGDGERERLQRRRRGFDDLSGHRLALVEALASGWGVSSTATGARMWFEVPTGERHRPS